MIRIEQPENCHFKHIVAPLDASKWIVYGSILEKSNGLMYWRHRVFIVSANGTIEMMPHEVNYRTKFSHVIPFREALQPRKIIGYLSPDGKITTKKSEAFAIVRTKKKQRQYELLVTPHTDNSAFRMLQIVLGTTLNRSHLFVTDRSAFKIIQLPGSIDTDRFDNGVAQLSADDTTIAIMVANHIETGKKFLGQPVKNPVYSLVILDNPLI